jgi:K+-H+ exchange-related protein
VEVYVIPLGSPPQERYELYCEVPDDDDGDGVPDAQQGFFKGLIAKFRTTLRRVEQERRESRSAEREAREPRSFTRRVRDRLLCWVAERIAEQRLLWHLRRQDSALAVYPEDLTGEQATAIIRRNLRRDAERHRRWLLVDGVLFVASGLLVLVPGPNVVAYYFGFRLVGHYLSMRGARQGLDGVAWTLQPSAPLADLRRVATLPADAREDHVRDVASRLRLEHLTAFFERVALPSA